LEATPIELGGSRDGPVGLRRSTIGRLPWGEALKLEHVLLAVISLFLLAVCVWPLTRLLLEGVAPNGTFDLSRAAEVLSSRSTWTATRRSLEASLVGALGALALGGLFAFLIALTDLRAKSALVFCFMIPMLIPPQVTALAWVQLLGPSSPLLLALGIQPPPGSANPLYSAGGVMGLLAIQHAPLAFLVLRASFRALPRELIEAARAAGSRPLGVARSIAAPLVAPALVAALALAFVSALGNFGIPAVLGIPASYTVLPILIYRRLASFGPSVIADVAVLSLIVAFIGIAVVLAQTAAARRFEARMPRRPGAALALPLGPARLAIEIAAWGVILLVLVLPLTALVAGALVSAYGVPLSPATATLANFEEVLLRQDATRRAFVNSAMLSGAAALLLAALAIPMGYFVVWRRSAPARALETLADIPYALPGVVLAIAMILVFLKPLPIVGISLYGTLWIIFAAYLGRFFALALRPVIAGFRAIDPTIEEAAQVAGARFGTRLRTVTAPLLAPVAAAGAILVFVTAFNELTVSALLWSAGHETLGVIMFNLDDSGFAPLASAVAVVSVAVILVLMLTAQLLARHLPPGVLPWAGERG